MPEQTQTAPFIDGLYGKLVEGGIGYFFPSAKFELLELEPGPGEHRITRTSVGTSLILNWLGSRYSLTRDEPFSEAELKLLTSIGAVLDSRYRMIVLFLVVRRRARRGRDPEAAAFAAPTAVMAGSAATGSLTYRRDLITS